MKKKKLIENTLADFLYWHHREAISNIVSYSIDAKGIFGDYVLTLNYDVVKAKDIKKDLLGLISSIDHYTHCITVEHDIKVNSVTLKLFDMDLRSDEIVTSLIR